MDSPVVLEMVQTAAGSLWECVVINYCFLSVIVSFHVLTENCMSNLPFEIIAHL